MLKQLRNLLIILVASCCLDAASAEQIADRFPGEAWDHVDPTQAGWSTELLARAKSWSQTIGSSAVIVIQRGVVVAEWGDTEKRMELASVRKSLLSALIGNAVERKQIDLATPIGRLGIDDNAPSLSPEEKTATIGDLLKARSGIYHAALYETPGMARRRPVRGSHPPGSFWYYNNWDFNALGAIYLQRTSVSIFDALDREIAKPIGMQDYRPSDGEYSTGKASVYPAYPIRMSARDLARFALLYLHDGRWKDRQLVPADWVRDSVKSHSDAHDGLGYGYLWWTDFLDPARPTTPVHLPQGSFFAWGSGGQYAMVIPALDMVIVHRVDRDIADFREVGLPEFGHLLWLILSAARQPNIGPDISLNAAKGAKLDDVALNAALSGATLATKEASIDGEFRLRLERDGHYSVLDRMADAIQSKGSWEISHGRFCRTAEQETERRCFTVVADGQTLRFFNRYGLPRYELQNGAAQ